MATGYIKQIVHYEEDVMGTDMLLERWPGIRWISNTQADSAVRSAPPVLAGTPIAYSS